MTITTNTKTIEIKTKISTDRYGSDVDTAYIINNGEEEYLTHCNIAIGWKLYLTTEDIINALIKKGILLKNEEFTISK